MSCTDFHSYLCTDTYCKTKQKAGGLRQCKASSRSPAELQKKRRRQDYQGRKGCWLMTLRAPVLRRDFSQSFSSFSSFRIRGYPEGQKHFKYFGGWGGNTADFRSESCLSSSFIFWCDLGDSKPCADLCGLWLSHILCQYKFKLSHKKMKK